jgi:DNA-binding MarR family transcriptional regulator
MYSIQTRLLQFGQQFWKFYERGFAPVLRRTGLSMGEIHVLLFLVNNPGFDTARDVSELRGFSKSQVSQSVDKLCARDLLCRVADPSDRRVIHLHLAKSAHPLAEECQRLQTRCIRQLLAGFTAEETAQLCMLLERVVTNGAVLTREAEK